MQPELLDALLWNRPALQGSGSHSSMEFVDALDLRPIDGDVDEKSALSLAAHAILAEFSDDQDGALEGYLRLMESGDPGWRLFGLFLLCWSNLDRDPHRVAEAQEEIEQIPDSHLRARLTAKLIAAAFDHGWDELLPQLMERAQGWAKAGSMLKVMLDREAMNLLGAALPDSWAHDPDPLTEYRWITDKAAEAAEKALTTSVEEAAKAPWLLSFSIGAAPLNPPAAAEMQVRWAGAIWLRSEVQTQLAAHLLRGGAQNSQGYAGGVALWALGGGRQLRDVIDAAEPKFDGASADFVVRSLMRSGPVAHRFNHRLIEASLECWDLVSDELAIELLNRFLPSNAEHPIARQIAALWAAFSLRVPDVFEDRLQSISDEDALAVLAVMSPVVGERLPLGSVKRLYRLGTSGSIVVDALPTLTVFIDRLDLDEELIPYEDLPPRVVADLAWRGSDLVDRIDLRKAVDRLTGEIQQLADEARKGAGQLMPHSPFNTLAAASAKLGELPDSALGLLLGLVKDPRLLRNIRYDAIRALTTTVAHGAVSPDAVQGLIGQIPEAGAESLWASYPPQLIRSAKTELAMASGLIEDFLPDLLSLSRDADARVRIDAIEGAVLGRQRESSYQLESILLGGLFDPSTKVIQRAVNGFSEHLPEDRAVRVALAERLEILYDIGDRDTRAAIARLSGRLGPEDDLYSVASSLKTRAKADRSFEVRLALNDVS